MYVVCITFCDLPKVIDEQAHKILHAGEMVCTTVEHTSQVRSTHRSSADNINTTATAFSAVLVYASYIYNIKIYSSKILLDLKKQEKSECTMLKRTYNVLTVSLVFFHS